MASKTESGDGVNMANFTALVQKCEQQGAAYNPFASKITIASLKTKEKIGLEAQTALKSAIANWKPKAAKRAEDLDVLKAYALRANALFDLTDAPTKTKESVKNLSKTIRGIRITKLEEPETNAGTPETPAKRTRSTSQQGIDSILNNFESLLESLQAERTYVPNEEDMSVDALQIRWKLLVDLNVATDGLGDLVNASRNLRNDAFYAESTGMIDLAKAVKSYLKGTLGTKSSVYLEIKGIAFKDKPI